VSCPRYIDFYTCFPPEMCRKTEKNACSKALCCHVNCNIATCIKSVGHNLHQFCSSQLASSLQFTTCISPQLTTCIKSAVHNLHQACSSQLVASPQFTTCIKPAVHNLHQICSSHLAASLLTTCNRFDIIKPEQAMRTHPDIGLMIVSCIKSAADLLQLARFWLCTNANCIIRISYTRVS
jgi:hypothetical protein